MIEIDQDYPLSGQTCTLAVGAIYEDSAALGVDGEQQDDTASGSGAVYVFTRNNGSWSQQAYIKASNTEAGDVFGGFLSLSSNGNTLAVGAKGEDSGGRGVGADQSDNSAQDSGAVYVFERNAGSWSQQAYIKASNADAGDGLGHSVALSESGDMLVATATLEDGAGRGINPDPGDNAATDSGAAYVFTRSGGQWVEQAYIKPSNAGSGDHFGGSAALSSDGRRLAISAGHEDSNGRGVLVDVATDDLTDSGAVYYFFRGDGGWQEAALLKAPNADANDQFGNGVSMSSDGLSLAVGAPGEASASRSVNQGRDDNAQYGAGAAYLLR